jgi:hypothetical protein
MWLKYMVYGLIAAALIHMMMASSCLDQLTGPEDESDVKAKIEEGATKAEEAFLSGDTTALKAILTPTALAFYEGEFPNIQTVMAQIGTAMKNRKLEANSEQYAEYSIDFQSGQFLMTFALQDDGSWKLIRF